MVEQIYSDENVVENILAKLLIFWLKRNFNFDNAQKQKS